MASNTTFELCVAFALHLVKPAVKIAMGREDLPELDEGAHDGDVDLDSAGLRSTLESVATPCSVKA